MSDGDEEYIALLDLQADNERIEEELKYSELHPLADGSRTPQRVAPGLRTPQPPNAESGNASSAASVVGSPAPPIGPPTADSGIASSASSIVGRNDEDPPGLRTPQPPSANDSANASSASSIVGSSRLSRKRKQGTYKVRRRKHRGVS
jgi:hypothetical protein